VYRKKPAESNRVKYWEIIADNLSKAGWSWGCVSAVKAQGRTIWIVDAHRGDGKRFVVRADEKLTAFVELESAVRTELGQKNVKTESDQNNWNDPVPVISQRRRDSLLRVNSICDHAPYCQQSIENADQHK